MFKGTLSKTVDPFQETNPDAIGNFFSSSSTASDSTFDGFGPGDYSGGYTGTGDRVYWGPFGDSDSIVLPPPAVSKTHPKLGGLGGLHFGPGFLTNQPDQPDIEVPSVGSGAQSSTTAHSSTQTRR